MNFTPSTLANLLALGFFLTSTLISPTLACGYHSKRYLAAKAALDASTHGQTHLMPRQRIGDPLATLRILNPYPNVFAYYDGRTGERFHSPEPNWLDDGAFALGVSTYSIVDGDEALLYDAHITTAHAAAMLAHVASLGVTKTTLVYSHQHNDHIAGAPVFAGNLSTIVGTEATAQAIAANTESLAADDPPIAAVRPTWLYSGNTTIAIGPGRTAVQLHNFNIHTPDGTVLFLPDRGLLFAGDTLEDTATFVANPEDLATHAAELQRMKTTLAMNGTRILPAHGSPDRIAAGGYDTSFIDATMRYIGKINEPVAQPMAWSEPLSEVVKDDVASGALIYFAQYEAVHTSNVEGVQEARQAAAR